MQVRILNDIFNDSSNNDELNNLLTFFRIGKHKMVLDNDDIIESFKNSSWKEEINSRDLKVVENYIRSSTKKQKDKLLINISSQNTTDYFQPNEAYLYLDQPLIILIENSEFEPPFINAIFRNFDLTGELQEAQKMNWWKYVMDAGSSVEQVINGAIENDFKNDILTKLKENYLRYYVIMDSDKIYSKMVVNSVVKKEKYLTKKGVRYHVLYKREKENYIPDSVLTELNNSYFNSVLSTFKENDQKDFFDIEKGFNNKGKTDRNWSEEVKNFYSISSIIDKDWTILKKGAIDIEIYKSGKYKNEFSKLFNNLNKNEMLEKIRHQPMYNGTTDQIKRNEFEHIINEIKKLL